MPIPQLDIDLFAEETLLIKDADRFVVERNPRDHMGWGNGTHSCAGMHLARMEMEALVRALLRNVESIETGDPKPILNNILQGFGALPT